MRISKWATSIRVCWYEELGIFSSNIQDLLSEYTLLNSLKLLFFLLERLVQFQWWTTLDWNLDLKNAVNIIRIVWLAVSAYIIILSFRASEYLSNENKVFLIINLIHNATSYVHRCRTFPNCKYGNNCLYIHPKCKYDSSCTRYDCTYLHTSPRILPPGMCSFYFDDLLKSSLVLFEILDVIILFVAPARPHVAAAGMNQPCKYYYNCTNPVCPYLHPKVRFRANSLYLFIFLNLLPYEVIWLLKIFSSRSFVVTIDTAPIKTVLSRIHLWFTWAARAVVRVASIIFPN